MSQHDQLVNKIRRELRTSDSPSGALTILERLGEEVSKGALTGSEVQHLTLTGLEVLKDLAKHDFETARSAIMNYLLPYALTCAKEKESAVASKRFRDLLSNWIEQYSENEKNPLRAEVLDVACDALKTGDAKAACWTIASIGYRSDALWAQLWSVAERGHETATTALSAIVALGVPRVDRNRVISSLRTLMKYPPPSSLVYVMQELADRQTLEFVLAMLDTPKRDDTRDDSLMQTASAFSILGRIADEAWDDHEFQDHLWSRIAAQRDESPDEFSRPFVSVQPTPSSQAHECVSC